MGRGSTQTKTRTGNEQERFDFNDSDYSKIHKKINFNEKMYLTFQATISNQLKHDMQNLLIYLYINIINNVWVTITKWHQVHYNISDSETKYNINEALLSQVSSKNSIISSLGYTVSLRTLVSCCLQKSVQTCFFASISS